MVTFFYDGNILLVAIGHFHPSMRKPVILADVFGRRSSSINWQTLRPCGYNERLHVLVKRDSLSERARIGEIFWNT
jgi:hypothetical protein